MERTDDEEREEEALDVDWVRIVLY